MIYYIVLGKTRKKLSCCNENIQYNCFKKLRCIIKKKLKFNGTNNGILLGYLPFSFTTSLHELIFKKRIKIPRAESCAVMWRHHCLNKIWSYFVFYGFALIWWRGYNLKIENLLRHLPIHWSGFDKFFNIKSISLIWKKSRTRPFLAFLREFQSPCETLGVGIAKIRLQIQTSCLRNRLYANFGQFNCI